MVSIFYEFTNTVAYSPHAGDAEAQKTLRSAIVQQQWRAAEPHLASPPYPSLCSTPCVAKVRGKHWIAQQ